MTVEYTEEAKRDLRRLDREVARRIIERVRWFCAHFQEQAPEVLSGEYRGMYKLRVGDWRVLYEIRHDPPRLIVHIVDHRSRIYR